MVCISVVLVRGWGYANGQPSQRVRVIGSVEALKPLHQIIFHVRRGLLSLIFIGSILKLQVPVTRSNCSEGIAKKHLFLISVLVPFITRIISCILS